MGEPPSSAGPKPCCVCDEPGGKHCTKCKSRHYCSKACQLVDWYDRGHKAQCKQLGAEFQDRFLDELMPAKVKIKEEPAIVDDVAPADGSKAPRPPAARTTAEAKAKASALNNNALDWRGTCAICLDGLPIGDRTICFYECCSRTTCDDCAGKCQQHDTRCPLCRAPPAKSGPEWLRRLQSHVDKGNTEAQIVLGDSYSDGLFGVKKSAKRAFQLYELAAAQGHANGQCKLGLCYRKGDGVKIDYKTAALWYRRAAEQGYSTGQYNIGQMFHHGRGVAQSHEESVKWYRLAAAQGYLEALYNLGACYANGEGVPQDLHEALRLFKRAAAKGNAEAAAKVEELGAWLAARSG